MNTTKKKVQYTKNVSDFVLCFRGPSHELTQMTIIHAMRLIHY